MPRQVHLKKITFSISILILFLLPKIWEKYVFPTIPKHGREKSAVERENWEAIYSLNSGGGIKISVFQINFFTVW